MLSVLFCITIVILDASRIRCYFFRIAIVHNWRYFSFAAKKFRPIQATFSAITPGEIPLQLDCTTLSYFTTYLVVVWHYMAMPNDSTDYCLWTSLCQQQINWSMTFCLGLKPSINTDSCLISNTTKSSSASGYVNWQDFTTHSLLREIMNDPRLNFNGDMAKPPSTLAYE